MLLACSLALAAPWHGNVNDAFHATVDPDLSALPDTVSLLYGDPATNPGLARVLAWHHVSLDAEGVTLGATRVVIHDPFFIAALPNPEHPERPVIVYTAWQAEARPKLNRVFHGPTPITLGSTADYQASWAGDWRADADGRLSGLAVGAATLTREEALEDLHALTTQLDRGWAGMEDLRAQLAPDTWEARVAAAEQHLRERESWTWAETWTALTDLLAPVRDAHFSLVGSTITGEGKPMAASARLNPMWRPRFADGRLTEVDGAWDLDGTRLAEAPPPVPGPHDVALGVAYRFPTLLADGKAAWLLGSFALAGTDPPPLVVDGHAFPLHRPRSDRTTRADAWSLAGSVLTVTTMREPSLAGMVDTARALRKLDRVVLDVRGNGGGSDHPAQEWAMKLHPGPYRWTPGTNLRVEDGPRADRLHAWPEGSLGRPAGKRAYHGRLQVLVDGGVASSGETFVQLAAQVPGAILYGTSTSGCSRYGNLEEQAPLPHTGIVATFGHTAFRWDEIRPVVEGVGIFPDVWLDEVDPVAFVSALP